MNIICTPSVPSLREALYTLAIANEIPDAKVLDDVVCQYPQYSVELTEFAIAIAIDALRGDADVAAAEAQIDTGVVSAAVNRAMSRFHNRLFEVASGQKLIAARADKSAVAAAGLVNPIAALSRDEFRSFTRRLNVNNVFGMKLRDRKIAPTTLTHGFKRRLADDLGVPLDVIVAHFAAGHSVDARASQFYKSDGKPTESGQQTFDEAVRCSGLTDEQQRYLLDL